MNDLDAVIRAMYESVCFEPGERPDWSAEDELFAPGARMVRVHDGGVFEMDLDAYHADVDRMIDSGELPSFWEAEIWRETRLFDDVAHVLSAYEARRSRGGETIGRGVNSIQLFRRDGHWRISAMLWRREGKAVRIPDRLTP